MMATGNFVCGLATAALLLLFVSHCWHSQPLDQGIVASTLARVFVRKPLNTTVMRVTLVGEGLDPWDNDYEMQFLEAVQEVVYSNATVEAPEAHLVEVLETRKVEPARDLIGADAVVLDLEIYDTAAAIFMEAAAEDSHLARLLNSKGLTVYMVIWDNGVSSPGTVEIASPAEPIPQQVANATDAASAAAFTNRKLQPGSGEGQLARAYKGEAESTTSHRRLLNYEINWVTTATGIVLGFFGLTMLTMGCCVCCVGAAKQRQRRRYAKAQQQDRTAKHVPGSVAEVQESEMAAYKARMRAGQYGDPKYAPQGDTIVSSYLGNAGAMVSNMYQGASAMWGGYGGQYGVPAPKGAPGYGTYQPPRAVSFAGVADPMQGLDPSSLSDSFPQGMMPGGMPAGASMAKGSVQQMPYTGVPVPNLLMGTWGQDPSQLSLSRPATPPSGMPIGTPPPGPSRPLGSFISHDIHTPVLGMPRGLASGDGPGSILDTGYQTSCGDDTAGGDFFTTASGRLSPVDSPAELRGPREMNTLSRGVSVGPPRNVFTPPGISGLASDYEQGMMYNPSGGFSALQSFSAAPQPLLREPEGQAVGMGVPGRTFDPHSDMGRPIFTPDVADMQQARSTGLRATEPQSPLNPRRGARSADA